MRRITLATFLIALLPGCYGKSSGSMEPIETLSPSRTVVLANIRLSTAAQRGFESFQSEGVAYGAMYVTRDGNNYFWRTGSFSAEDVAQEAEAACEALAGRDCTIYAQIEPVLEAGEIAVPLQASQEINRAYLATTPGNFVALAAMPAGAFGYAWNATDSTSAGERALAECSARKSGEQQKYSPDVALSLENDGVFDCRLLWVTQRRQ